MADLTPDQRNYFYLIEAARAGIHKPILAALYAAHGSPNLSDGETGLGIAPVNRVATTQVETFPQQVQYAANTVRSITDRLTAQGLRSADLWNAEQGRYSDRFIQTVATGYNPPASDPAAALLEPTNNQQLRTAYLADLTIDYQADQLPQNLAYLDGALLRLVDRIPTYFQGLSYQREALLEALRLWRKLDTREQAIASLNLPTSATAPNLNELDRALTQFIQQASPFYGGFPHQREALLRLTQLWRQLDSREQAIASLQQNTSAEANIQIIDPALVAFVQRVPQFYQGQGTQRNALTESFRLWRGIDSRNNALVALGVSPQFVASPSSDPAIAQQVAQQIDRELLAFARRVPGSYQETQQQRESLIRLVQLWRGLETRERAIQSLLEDIRRMEQARRDSLEAPPRPAPPPPPARPVQWTPNNIRAYLYTSIIPNGSFTWAEATQGGTRIPPNQATVNAIVRIAALAQQARDRIGRPFRVTSWYRPPDVNRRVGGASMSRHIVGDAIDFYVEGLTGNQLYWTLDPWWPGGLGRYQQFPYLCHLDARGFRARWLN